MSNTVPEPGVIELDCRAERQQTISWCWAACICGIARFAKAEQVPTEGELVNLALGRTDCTHDPVPAACVVPAPPVSACLCDCLHYDDVAAIIIEKGWDKRPPGK